MWSLTQLVYNVSVLSVIIIVESTRSESIEISQRDATEHLDKSSLIYGIFKDILRNEESECARDVKVILEGIQNRDVWALKSKLLSICF